MSSRFGNMQCGLLTAALSCLKSTHILTDQFFFLTGTIGEHQSVGSVVFWIMPFCSIRPSSPFITSASGNGILLGVTMLCGFALSISLIFTGYNSCSSKYLANAANSFNYSQFGGNSSAKKVAIQWLVNHHYFERIFLFFVCCLSHEFP